MSFSIRACLIGCLLSITLVHAQQVTIKTTKPTGIYKVGEGVVWHVQCSDHCDSMKYTLKKGALKEVESGYLSFTDGVAKLLYTFDAPGAILLEVRWGEGQEKRALGGAVADMEKIALSESKPKDFDSFWKAKLKELKKTSNRSKLTKGESGLDNVDYWKITMSNIRKSQIQGQLARPKEGEKLPALLIVQWAGVYPLKKEWVVERANQGWLVLNIMAHDLPIDEQPNFYKRQADGPLKNYASIGNDDPDNSYFLRMYLSCYKAVEYLTDRSDWDGETLVVMGDSQGGQQALVTAGLHPSVTAAIALVPAGFDMLGPRVGRKGGWPQWYNNVEGKDPAKVREASRYYDVANFIPNIKCSVLVGVGLLDEVCPPEGILAGLNQLKIPKMVMVLPESTHQDKDGSQELFKTERDMVWLQSLQAGYGVPMR